ncbi:hypothetical protein AGLY_003286 [Aphis glycines]|uniref:Uncharacterized protein n=1 Tax=Aphis glycines TaxID=307491 RepID=A0A6G0U005_APHGL|nr:hypothetical protein AGLY_003286 [Aphis glycines]
MEGFKEQLIVQSSVRFMSVGDLTVGRTYPITKMCYQETQYGRTVRCTLDDSLDGIIEVFLPRSIVISDEQEALYNIDGNQTLSLVFNGRRGRSVFTSLGGMTCQLSQPTACDTVPSRAELYSDSCRATLNRVDTPLPPYRYKYVEQWPADSTRAVSGSCRGMLKEKKGEFLGYLYDMIKREKHNVTTFLRWDEAPSCLKSHMENERFKRTILYSNKDWLDALPEANEMLEHDRKRYKKETKQMAMVSRKRSDRMDQLLRMFLCIMMVQGQSLYTIEEFKNETSIFYENQGEIRIIGAHWELVTYIPLSDYDLRHYQLE